MRLIVRVGLTLCVAGFLAGCNDSKLAQTHSNIEVSPAEVLFQQTLPGSSNSEVVTVTNKGGSALTLDAIEVGGEVPEVFNAISELGLPLALGPGEWATLQVTYAPMEVGDHAGILTVFSSDNGTPSVDVPLLTSPIAGDIDAQPNPLTFGAVTIGQPVTQSITVTNVGAAPLAVSGAQFGSGTSSWFSLDASSLPATLAPGTSVTLPVTFTSQSTAAVTGTVEIASDDPDEATAVVVLGGSGTNQMIPDINAAPSSVNFAQVERLTCKTVTTNVQNVGTATLNVTGISRTFFTSTEFTFSPSSFQVAPGSAQVLSVTYCPVDTGFDFGGLSVSSNDPDENPYTINLSGEGIPPPITATDISVEVTWNNATDVDTHFLRPGATFNQAPGDCYYSNLSPDWGVAFDSSDDPYLDYDDTDGYGPENLNFAKPQTGTYQLVIWYYSDYGIGPATTTVKVWLDGTPTPIYQATRTINMSGQRKWTVGNILWDAPSDSGTWQTVDTFSASFAADAPSPPKT